MPVRSMLPLKLAAYSSLYGNVAVSPLGVLYCQGASTAAKLISVPSITSGSPTFESVETKLPGSPVIIQGKYS